MLLALQKQRRAVAEETASPSLLLVRVRSGSAGAAAASAGGLLSGQVGARAMHGISSTTGSSPAPAAAGLAAAASAALGSTTSGNGVGGNSTSSRSALHTTTPASSAAATPIASSAPPRLLGRGRFYDTVRVAPVEDPDAVQRQAGKAPPPPFPGRRTPTTTTATAPTPTPWWQLTLRGYPVKTPGHNALLLPTRALALAVAAEWEWLPDGKPLSVAMPLTALCATALDQPKPRPAVEQSLLKFVHTDAAAVRYDPGTALERKQREMFDDLLAWAADPQGPIRAPDGSLVPSSAVFGAPQTAGTEAAFARYLASLDAWTLAAVDQATAASKSLVVAAALAHGRVSVEEAVRMARLEEDHQTGEWGVVEAGHDLDACDAATRVASASVLLRLLRMA
jgi:ATP synthase mitochondrial F1 complex assembly factor 2